MKIVSVDGNTVQIENNKSEIEELNSREFKLLYDYGINFDSNLSNVDKLKDTLIGTCLYLRINFKKKKKVVYLGKRNNRYKFYSGGGADGVLEIDCLYMLSSKNIHLDFDCEQSDDLLKDLQFYVGK